MFSGLTNQFSSLVGAVKGGQADEDVPAPTAESAAAEAAAAVEHEANAAAGGMAEQPVEGEEGAKSGWLGSAKGWLGSASIPSMPAMPSMAMPSMPAMPAMPSIPGLRKGGADAEAGADGAAAAEHADATGAVSGDDDDKSRYISATEGADSHPASGGGTPTGEEGQIGHGKGEEVKMTTKVTQQAKHFGSFLSSAISKAGTKIKETVKDNNILDSFNKEQDAFIKGQSGADSGVAPWIGHTNEAKIKEEILGLSQDRRNFVRAPPAGVDFEFNYETSYPTAIAIMAEDKALETMRFELVPKIITEENFWRNYFYRVSLIIQAAELGTLGADGVGQASSGEDVKISNESESEIKTQNQKQELNIATENDKTNQNNSQNAKKNNKQVKENAKIAATTTKSKSRQNKNISESEFVSDAFVTTEETDLQEIKDGMRKLGIDSMAQQALTNDEEQWEKDLEAELKDYEVVSSAGGGGGSANRKATTTKAAAAGGSGGGDNDDELPTIPTLRTRSTNNDWEEYADLIEDTDDLKTLKSLKRAMLGYESINF